MNQRTHPRRPRRSANDPCEICQDCRIERESQRNLESRIVTSSTIVTDRFEYDPTHFVQGLQNVAQILRNGVPSLHSAPVAIQAIVFLRSTRKHSQMCVGLICSRIQIRFSCSNQLICNQNKYEFNNIWSRLVNKLKSDINQA